MKRGIAEILAEAARLKKKAEKIDYLRQNWSVPLGTVLRYALEPHIRWVLPEGDVPYKPNKFLDAEGRLYSEARKLYLFCEGGERPSPVVPGPAEDPRSRQSKDFRRQKLFIELLESITPEDAELLCAAKDKKLPYRGLDRKTISEAFPGLLTEVPE